MCGRKNHPLLVHAAPSRNPYGCWRRSMGLGVSTGHTWGGMSYITHRDIERGRHRRGLPPLIASESPPACYSYRRRQASPHKTRRQRYRNVRGGRDVLLFLNTMGSDWGPVGSIKVHLERHILSGIGWTIGSFSPTGSRRPAPDQVLCCSSDRRSQDRTRTYPRSPHG